MNKTLALLLGIISLISCKDDTSQENQNSVVYYNGDIITMQGDKPIYVDALVVKDDKINYPRRHQPGGTNRGGTNPGGTQEDQSLRALKIINS